MNHQKHIQDEIIIFTRYPQAGVTKTRLIPELGADGAARIQRQMTEQIIRTARKVADERGPRLSVYFTGGPLRLMQEWLGPELIYHEQRGVDLGQKMMSAFHDSRSRGSKRAVIIGSDCPAMDSRHITDALAALQDHRLVLGPANDGGYYMIGTTSSLPSDKLSLLFTDISWGTSNVFRETLRRAHDENITPSLLEKLHDIDHPQDLAYFHHHPNPQ